jgi:8-oxo-dGTP pyrophosphatase MutT (NUDIX family)
VTVEPDPVLAFGGVVWQMVGDLGEVRVAVVHRPRYDDWSFPKGKAEPGESPIDTARREVDEETGLDCRLGSDLGTIEYPLGDGRRKVVGFWTMEVVGERHRVPDAEVDQMLWWSVDTAARRLTHPQDREVLERFVAWHQDRIPSGPRPSPG